MRIKLTEDEVRNSAGEILEFKDTKEVKSGTGQLTTFNQLGFKNENKKPDGWYLPKDTGLPAIILETKNSSENLNDCRWEKEILDNCGIAHKKYDNVIGILYNGYDIRVFKNEEEIDTTNELQHHNYYLDFFRETKINKSKIYSLTKKINDCLHFKFGINDLYERMIFTACALVAKRYGAKLDKGMNYETFHTSILSTLNKSLEDSLTQNRKLNILTKKYSEIEMNSTSNQEAIDDFIEWVSEISKSINSNNWNGEDVMGIFFNEFNRYKPKSEHGQVFTPDHITSLMYRLIDVNQDDVVLDAACGSGGFLVKSMCNMIKEAGGPNTRKAKKIKENQLFGIEFYKEIYALACANMLIHKDGKTNIAQLDTREEEACEWIKSKPITKVLMNPPFENKYGCLKIVENVLDNVKKDTLCAFILPDTKLDKNKARKKSILKNHRLTKIIKLPEEIFKGVTTSIFIFQAGVPQKDQPIFGCYIEKDGLVTVKNQGRHDIKDEWKAKEDYWVDIIRKQSGDLTCKWIDVNVECSYKLPKKEFSVKQEDFEKTVLDYYLYQQGVDVKIFKENLLNSIMYGYETKDLESEIISNFKNRKIEKISCDCWKEFYVKDLFITNQRGNEINVPTGSMVKRRDLEDGNTPRITVTGIDNGIVGYYNSNSSEYRCYNNFISVSFLSTVFYQQSDASLEMKVHCLKPKEFNFNIYTGLFFVTIIRNAVSNSNYLDQISSSILPNITFKVPVNSNNEIDFEFMEKYIKSMPYGDRL